MTDTGTNSQGLGRAKELYENRYRRAKELKAEGKRVIGYFCCSVPLELFTAVEAVPFRIMGNLEEPITEADLYLESRQCGFIRGCFDVGIKGGYDFLDGFVVPHTCEHVQRVYDIWTYYIKHPYNHFLNLPHTLYPSSQHFFKAEVGRLKKSLEQFTGIEISDSCLRDAIQLHNENRALLRELNDLRGADPPLVSGVEMTEVVVASMVIPAVEQNELLKTVIEEVKKRPEQERPDRKSARVLVSGSHIDSTAIIQLIEDCGVNVVADDLCMGARVYNYDVEVSADPLDGLSSAYLNDIMCPRTYRGGFQENREQYFGHIMNHVKACGVDGVILYILNFCDCNQYDIPALRDYLRESGFPVLHLEDNYSLATLGQLRTRVQGFAETLSQK